MTPVHGRGYSRIISEGNILTRTLETESRALAPGTLFAGRYLIIEEAGRGGMGVVYKAQDTKLEERIALKVLAPEIAAEPHSLERFRRELTSARRVTHANVVRVHDFGESDGTAFLTMEYAPGQTLRAVLNMAGRLDPRTSVGYARQACAGLAEAHRAGIIHRDLKPQNLMIDERHRLRIMDFGIARPMAGGGPTREGSMVGTPAYMAPEQVEGRDVDSRTDLYALGVILFEMTTGRLPFEAESEGALARRRLMSAPPSPASINPALPAALDGLILRCLARDPAGRPASAEAMDAELEAVAAGMESGPESRTPIPRTAAAAASRARRFRVAGVAAAAAIILGSAAYLIVRSLSAPPPPTGWDSRLAVLPLLDASPGRDQAVFCDGMTRDLRDKLAASGGLKIISEYSSDRYRGSEAAPDVIGRALGARHILSGRLSFHQDALSAEMTLSDARNGVVIWRMPYSGSEGEYFAIQAQITADVMDRLAPYRARTIAATRAAADPASLEAYTDYLTGRRLEARYRNSDAAADFDEAARLYRAALAHDARYTLALRGLGDLHEARYVKAGDPTDLALMLESYRNAFETDPELPDSMIAMGWTYFYQQNQEEAARYFLRARQTAPEQSSVLLAVGAFLRSLGLFERAVGYFERAAHRGREIDPLYIGPAFQLAVCLGSLGRFAEGEAVVRGTQAVDPNNGRVRLLLGRMLMSQGRHGEARQELAALGSAEKMSPTIRRQYDLLQVWLAAASGDEERSLGLIKASDRAFTYDAVNALCRLGRKQEALAAIEEGIAKGFLAVKDYLYGYSYLTHNPFLDILRPEPRFQAVLADRKEVEDRFNRICAGL